LLDMVDMDGCDGVMRKRRVKVNEGDGFYHCMSRTVNGEKLFGAADKEVFRKMIHRVADFSGVEVLTYCVMDNHFHVLVRIGQDARKISDSEVVRRYRCLYPKGGKYQQMKPHVLREALLKKDLGSRMMREQILKRMGDVSEFMKTLKQRFSVYYNQNHKRYGTLWAERFKSVLVEPDHKTILAMAAYIDLNPVRAGVVEDPKDYRYCGYAEAVAGGKRAKQGIGTALMGYPGAADRSAMARYRMVLFGIGSQAQKEGTPVIGKEKTLEVLEKEKGKVPLAALLRCRMRYFTDGLVLGSRLFLENQMGDGKTKSREVPASDEEWSGIYVAKGFRGPPIL